MSAKVLVECAACERKFTRYRCQARRVKAHFCSRACYHDHASKAVGVKWENLDARLDQLVSEGLGDREIAVELGVPVDACKRRRRSRHGRRARRRLQDYSTGALTEALRAKGYSVRLVRIK